jgi:hypothetical protein
MNKDRVPGIQSVLVTLNCFVKSEEGLFSKKNIHEKN